MAAPDSVPTADRSAESVVRTGNGAAPSAAGVPLRLEASPDGGPVVSIVVPLLNEAESLPELVQQIAAVFAGELQIPYEIIFIDDGSTDGSFGVIQQLRADGTAGPLGTIRALRFRTNYGKSAALSEGFKRARGRFVVTMDADLQDDPREVPRLLDALNGTYDLVSGWKQVRHDPISKTLPSKFFNKVTATLTGIPLHDFNCGLKAYRREVIEDIHVYGELHRYLPVLAKWAGYRIGELPVEHHARKYGHTKFGLDRFLKGFLDLLTVIFTTKYMKRPMHFFGGFGMTFLFIGLLICGWLTVDKLLGAPLSNRPMLFLGILLIIVGIQAFSVGLIGEMITKVYTSEQSYAIREELG